MKVRSWSKSLTFQSTLHTRSVDHLNIDGLPFLVKCVRKFGSALSGEFTYRGRGCVYVAISIASQGFYWGRGERLMAAGVNLMRYWPIPHNHLSQGEKSSGKKRKNYTRKTTRKIVTAVLLPFTSKERNWWGEPNTKFHHKYSPIYHTILQFHSFFNDGVFFSLFFSLSGERLTAGNNTVFARGLISSSTGDPHVRFFLCKGMTRTRFSKITPNWHNFCKGLRTIWKNQENIGIFF